MEPSEKPGFVIREAQPADFAGVQVLEDLDFSVHAKARPDYFREAPVSYPQSEFEELLSKPCPLALVAEAKDELVGLCFGFVTDHPGDAFCKPRRFALIQDLVVLPQYRGRGIASALLNAARQRAVQAGAVSLELCVWEFNDGARALYDKLGMRVQYSRMEMNLT